MWFRRSWRIGLFLVLLFSCLMGSVLAAGEKVTDLPAVFPTTDTTYYGRWTANPSVIVFEHNGGSGVTNLNGFTGGVTGGTMPSSIKNGFNFMGWYDNPSFTGSAINVLPATYPPVGLKYYAKWDVFSPTVSFDTNGGSLISNQIIDYNSLILSSIVPSKTNFVFDGWYKDSSFVSIWNFATDRVTVDTTLYAKWLSLPAQGAALDTYSWSDIKMIADAGKGDTYFDVGQTKNVSIDGVTYVFRICGFDHDDKADGSGKANITFGLKGVMADLVNMNVQSSTSDGWSDSYMRAYLNGVVTTNQYVNHSTTSIYSKLPIDLQNAIVPVTKESDVSNSSLSPVVSTDKLFLFSFLEVIFDADESLSNDGFRYPVFGSGALDTTARSLRNPSGVYTSWFLRSSGYDDYANSYSTVEANGRCLQSQSAMTDLGVSFGFCIGSSNILPTMSFESNGGSIISSQTIKVGSKLFGPLLPKKSGFEFMGWYKDPELTQPWDFAIDVITVDATLYARWFYEDYDVTFDSNGGSVVSSQLKSNLDRVVTLPPAPDKDGWVFEGWCKDPESTQLWDFATDVVTADTTLYAKWRSGFPNTNDPLQNWSWDQINLVANAGTGSDYFDVAEEKVIILNNKIQPVQIYGFNHDVRSDDLTKANITFGLKDSVDLKRIINLSSVGSVGGWDGSDMRAYLNGITTSKQVANYSTTSFYETVLQDDIAQIVVPVNKLTSSGGKQYDSKSLITSSDKLFLLSQRELRGTDGNAYPGEGSQYSIFSMYPSLISKSSGSSYSWWLRSPHNASSDGKLWLSSGSAVDVSYNYCFVFAFAIGRQ